MTFALIASKRYGSPRVHRALRKKGVRVGAKRVARALRERAREEWEGRYASLPPAELLAQIDEALSCLRAERARLRAELGLPEAP